MTTSGTGNDGIAAGTGAPRVFLLPMLYRVRRRLGQRHVARGRNDHCSRVVPVVGDRNEQGGIVHAAQWASARAGRQPQLGPTHERLAPHVDSAAGRHARHHHILPRKRAPRCQRLVRSLLHCQPGASARTRARASVQRARERRARGGASGGALSAVASARTAWPATGSVAAATRRRPVTPRWRRHGWPGAQSRRARWGRRGARRAE